MKSAVLTGASGFIGKALLNRLLQEGYHVYAIVRNKEKLKDISSSDLTIIELMLEQYEKLGEFFPTMEKIDYFFHLAWDGVSGESLKDYKRQIRNVEYTINAVRVAKEIGVKKFIFAGTINQLEIMSFIGKDEIKPEWVWVYGTAKLMADMYLSILSHQFGIEFNTGIVGSAYGEGDYSPMVQNIVISHFLEGKTPKLVEADMMFDWVYVDDVVDGFLKIAEKGKNQKKYYIGHDTLTRFEDIITKVRDIINPSIPLEFGTLKGTARIDYDMIDITALSKDTGYQPSADFEKSILNTADWLKKTGNIWKGGGE